MPQHHVMHLVLHVADGRWHLERDHHSIASFDTRDEGISAGETRRRRLCEFGVNAQLHGHADEGAFEAGYACSREPAGGAGRVAAPPMPRLS